MCLTAILVAVFLAPLSPARDCSDAAWRVSAESAQAPAGNPQDAAPDQAPADQKQSESKPEETPPAKEAEKPSPPTSPGSRSATGVGTHRTRAHKPSTAAAAGEPRKIVVHQGGASEPIAQIVPGITQEEASHQRESAERLLASAESHLKQIAARSLTQTQQEMVIQIRQYMDGARSALKENDTQRAHTLAQKAYLLSDDLVGH